MLAVLWHNEMKVSLVNFLELYSMPILVHVYENQASLDKAMVASFKCVTENISDAKGVAIAIRQI